MIAALLFAAQAAAPAPSVPPQRIDLLNCPRSTADEIVVCGQVDDQRLPFPREAEPRAIPRQPTSDAMAGMDNAGTGYCASTQWGCQSPVNLVAAGTAAIRFVGKLIDPNSCCDHPGEATDTGALIGDVAKAFRKKPDRNKRIAIDLEAPPPPIKGRLAP